MNLKASVWVSLIIILSLVSISIYNADFSEQNNNAPVFHDSSTEIQTQQAQPETKVSYSRGVREALIDSNAHGGSWFDNFEDETGIDWAMSDQLFINKSKVKIGKLILSKPFQKDSNTVALWHFDEGTGTIVYDETDNYNNGTLGGDGAGTDLPTWTEGKFDSALGFDGVDDYIEVPDNTSLRLTDAFTLHAWVKPIASTVGTWQTILEKGSDSYGLYFSNDLSFRVYNGGLTPVSIQTPAVTLGEWFHLVATYNKTEGKRKLYLNGELVANSTHSSNISNSAGNPLGINKDPSNGDSFFNGTIDEVAICNRSLSAEEIKYLYGGDRYHITGNITSNQISIPENMNWDTLIINKIQPGNTYLNVTILDASNDQPIPGSIKYINEGEFDISNIDPSLYPSIKLNATFKGNGSASPILYSWGVSWVGDNCWKDTFFGGVKLEEDTPSVDGDLIISGSMYGVGTLDPNPAAIWHFDEGSDVVVEDATLNNNDGTIQGGALWTAGKFGQGLHFDGLDDYVNAPRVFNGNGDVTISAWVKFDSISYSIYPGVISIGKPSANQALQIFQMDGTGQLGISSWGNSIALTTREYNDDSWHQVVGRFYNGDTYDIFVDGEFQASNSGQYNIPSDGTTIIGGTHNSEYWMGSIDEVAVYKKALTNLEIRNWYYSVMDITSNSITLPEGSHWDTLIINKTESTNRRINVTILDTNTNQPIEDYFTLLGTEIDVSSIHPINHKSIKLKAEMVKDSYGLSSIHDWSINWTTNTPPKIDEITDALYKVNRTNTTEIFINVFDTCDPPQRLTVEFEYQSPKDTIWQSAFLSNEQFMNDSWVITFTPTKKAEIGDYSFKISCTDTFDETTTEIFENIIEVLNNPPTKPNVSIQPKSPITIDDLKIYATNSTDIEDEPITYYYEWYKNNELQPELTTELVSANYTSKNDSWKCVVTPNDGHDNGISAEVDVYIRNFPPEILTHGNFSAEVGIPFEFKLDVFDMDNALSDLTWQLHSTIDFLSLDADTGILSGILSLDGNYFINVSVKDTDGGIDWLTLKLNVLRVNRPPIITTIDNSYAKTGEFYFIDYNATDDFTDSELLKWAINTNASWLKINITTGELSGTPSKADAGWVWVNITVIDDEGERAYRYFIINISKSPNKIPILSSFRMLPPDGDTDTEFKFSVHYLDEDSEPPTMIQVFIDEVSFNLKLKPGDIPYKGKYENITKLTEGKHTYYFVASDGIDTITSDTFQTVYIENLKVDEPTEINWTWAYLLIIIIIVLIILFLILSRTKKQKSKEESKISKQPQLYPITTEQPSLFPSLEPIPSLPPVKEDIDPTTLKSIEDQAQLDMTEHSDTTQEVEDDIVVHLPSDAAESEFESEPIDQEPESILKGIELLPDDAEYMALEKPELIKDTRPLLREPVSDDLEPEIKDQVSEPKVKDSSKNTTE